MSQKQSKDKNLEQGKAEDMPIASRLSYYKTKPAEGRVIHETAEEPVVHETTENIQREDEKIRPSLHASIGELDDLKEVASIIDYSMFFNEKMEQERSDLDPSIIRPSLLNRVEEAGANIADLTIVSVEQEKVESNQIGTSLNAGIRPSLVDRVEEAGANIADLTIEAVHQSSPIIEIEHERVDQKSIEVSEQKEDIQKSDIVLDTIRRKSSYTSVLDRLGDDTSSVHLFGDGTSLSSMTDTEEKSIFSSAFADEKETDIVKVAFFQKKSKQNLTTAELAALPYFQEDKEFMSKVDEAWYDQGEKKTKNLVLVFSGLLLFFVTWAAFASIDEVARGQGQVVPSQRMQLLQHLEGGILNELLVAEGDTVEPDQILARVDNVSAASSLRDIESQITEANLALIRLEAERQGIEPIFPEKYMILAPEIVAAQEQTFLSRSLQQESSYGIFEQQIEQKHQELNEAFSRQKTYENARALVQKRVSIAQPLVTKKLYPEVDFLNLKQELVRLDGDIDAVKNSIAKINAEVREAEGRLSLSKKEFMSEVIKEINTLRSEIATLEEGKTAGTDRVTRTELRSQVRGVVNRILLNTKGGVVKPGESIMEIVPLDDTLVIETKVRPQDIAFIHPNQKAIVRITAYDASIYGTMDGFVEQIGADTVTDEQGEIFFLIKVRTEKSAIFHNGEALPIMPGMIASVDILTGKKTVLSYLLKPITKASQYALKER